MKILIQMFKKIAIIIILIIMKIILNKNIDVHDNYNKKDYTKVNINNVNKKSKK